MFTLYILCIFFYTAFLISLPSVTKKRTKINRGQVLASAVGATGLNKEKVAKKAGYSRSAYYKHIETPNLEFSILIAYGKAISHDFTYEFPEMPKYLISEPDEIYNKPKNLDEAMLIIDQLKNKYMELLEKYNLLIEDRMGKEMNRK